MPLEKAISYFILEDYGKFIPKDRQMRKQLSFDFKIERHFINFKRVYYINEPTVKPWAHFNVAI